MNVIEYKISHVDVYLSKTYLSRYFESIGSIKRNIAFLSKYLMELFLRKSKYFIANNIYGKWIYTLI